MKRTAGMLLLFLAAQALSAQPRVKVVGSRSPRTERLHDAGPVEPGVRLGYMRAMMRQTLAQKTALNELLRDQQDPASAQYRKWLTPEEYADRFGSARQDIDRVSSWLTAEGFTVEYTARGRDWIAFTGTAAQVEKTFQTPVHRYEGDGEIHISIAAEPSAPSDLAPLIQGFLSMDDFRPRSMAKPRFTSGGEHSLAPGDLAIIYNLSKLYSAGIDGTGQKIAIVGQSNVTLADIQAFRTQYGLGAANIQVMQTGNDPGFNDALEETDLDLEWAGAIARNASLIYLYSDSADSAAFQAIDQALAPVVSESFGTCEANASSSYAASYESEAKKANSMGISWIVSSGDTGAASCDYGATAAHLGLAVNFPASVPEVTAVGGTEFNEGSGSYWSTGNGANGGSALSYITEMAWNDTSYGGGIASTGGGVSSLYPKPTWQTGPGVPADGQRDVPDVAMAAANDHDPYNIITSGQSQEIGGTSAAAPVFAGLIALVNQYQKTNGLGNLNLNLYKLAQSSPGIFNDVVTGDNIVPCSAGSPNCVNGQFGYSAGPKYDLTTGLGSLNGYNLVTGWNGAPASSVTINSLAPSSATAGGAAFTLTVNGSGFATGAAVLWNGTAIPTTFVSATQLTATVAASLIASAAVVSITVSSGGKVSGAVSFPIAAASVTATFSNQRVTTQAPPASGCVLPSSVTSFSTTDNTVYLYFSGTVGTSDQVSSDWLAPDGTTVAGANWTPAAGSFCFTGASLPIGTLAGGKLGSWQGRVYDNGKVVFTVPFTVNAAGAALPVVSAVRNAASYASGAISPGEIVVLTGTGMGPATLVSGSFGANGILGSQVANTTVSFNGVNAPLIYSWATAVAAIVPYEIAGSASAQAVVSYQGRLSVALSIPVVASVPGIFTANSSGAGAAAALNQNGALNTASAPATPGTTIVLYVTGEGQLSPGGVDGKTATGSPLPHPVLPVSVTIGGVAATVAYAGSAPGEVEGLMQINAVIPQGVYGASVPIVVQVGSAVSQTGATIAVAAANAPFAVTSQLTTAAPAEDSSGALLCNTTPVSKSAFLTTDASVWVWFTFNGAQNGDVLTYNWIHPSGALDPKQPTVTIPFTGSGCAASSLSISGQEAASEPGNWKVRVLRNGVLLFTITFSIQAPAPVFTVTAAETAGVLATDANGNPSLCTRPSAKSAFLTTDPSVFVWFTYDGVQTGDVFSFNWIHPSGAVDPAQSSLGD